MKDLIPYAGFWFWWIVAALLLITELLVPGIFFIWVALAAAVVGTLSLFMPMSWQIEILLFAILAVVNVYFFYPYYIKFLRGKTAEPNLNNRAHNYIGRNFRLTTAISNGVGQVSIDDTLWKVLGPDLPVGETVRITGVKGVDLTAEPA